MWVVLMVPVSAFAAVVAMAGPQRLAAESSMQEAADDLAAFAVAWRDGHGDPEGPLKPFPPDCDQPSDAHQEELGKREGELDDLVNDPDTDPDDVDAKRQEIDEINTEITEWRAVCRLLYEALASDLGHLGVDSGGLSGFYSDSLNRSSLAKNVLGHKVPCGVAGEIVVSDAVHVVLAAKWQDGGWAASQVWPEGLPLAAESMGRLSLRGSSDGLERCQSKLAVLDSEGRPVWAGDPDALSRRLAQSVGRTPLPD